MVNFFDFDLVKFVDEPTDGVKALQVQIEEKYDFDMILDINKLDFFIKKNNNNLDTLINSCAYKIPGTDGVRGVAQKNSANDDCLQIFLKEKVLTPNFVNHYVKAFIKLIPSNVTEIAIAEDGRELLNNNDIKTAVIKALMEANINVIDLEIIPTPFLVAFSLEKGIPAIMITASHNPPQYNGIKLFLNGKKLYPFNKYGEFQLTYNFFTNKRIRLTPEKPLLNKTCYPINIFTKVFEQVDFNKVKKTLNNTPLYLDLANGAFSKIAKNYLKINDIDTISLACDLGIKNINENCGVALLEDLPFTVHNSEIPTIQRLLSDGEALGKDLYAIVCDGDGDRAFILKYNCTEKNVSIFNGDILGYIIAKNINDKEKKGQFCLTIESDYALSNVISEELGWECRTVGVGDRWLISSIINDLLFVGCERSGHVIIKNEAFNPPLLSGNGLLTALTALQFTIESYAVGYNKKITSYNFPLEDFYNGSPSWKKMDSKILEFSKFDYKEFLLDYEYNVLGYKLFNKENKEIGLIYIRKSGTEPKISVSISTLKQYEEIANQLLEKIEKELN